MPLGRPTSMVRVLPVSVARRRGVDRGRQPNRASRVERAGDRRRRRDDRGRGESLLPTGERARRPSLVSLFYWKGLARYRSVEVDGERLSHAAWYYSQPLSWIRKIKDRVASEREFESCPPRPWRPRPWLSHAPGCSSGRGWRTRPRFPPESGRSRAESRYRGPSATPRRTGPARVRLVSACS